MPPSADPFIGREILDGQFRIIQKIGAGGMGAVYKASQPAMNRMVGVKILHPKLANRKDLVSRFRREARAMSHLSHPNTVRVFLYGELDDGSLYIVMEFLDGKNLNQIVRAEGPLGLERALSILIQVCGALEEAHRAGIIHRDLKPENIFLSQQGGIKDYPKVLDFGLAKVTEREMRPGSLVLTQEGMVFGTPEFMSPEQAQGKTLTPASDIYSLAIILYEALTGKLPFDSRTSMEFIQLHVMQSPIPLNSRVPGIRFPPLLEAVISRALAKNPNDRYASAADFGQALNTVLATGYAPTAGDIQAVSLPDPGTRTIIALPDGPAPPSAGKPKTAHVSDSAETVEYRSGSSAAPDKKISRRRKSKSKNGQPPLLLLAIVMVGCVCIGAIVTVLAMRFLHIYR